MRQEKLKTELLNCMTENKKYTSKDFSSDQEVRWCPGCGDYSILKQVQSVMPQINVPKENIVFISGALAFWTGVIKWQLPRIRKWRKGVSNA